MAKRPADRPADRSAEPTMSELLHKPVAVDLATADTSGTPGAPKGGKAAAQRAATEIGERLSDLQERLYAEGRTGGTRSLLLVLQGMDTSGKGGIIRHVVGMVDPQGVALAAFKKPTKEELAHDFLWRIRQRVPKPGYVGVFDRSHYEDVGVARVHQLVPRSTVTRRYASINRFESALSASGTRLVKVWLHISPEEQRERLLTRLDDPRKHWKFNPADIDERAYWADYMAAYSDALNRCSTDEAPWYVVPADRKWYRNYAVARLLLEHLEAMDPQWPAGDFDVAAERSRLTTG